jgi:hypothetical protein
MGHRDGIFAAVALTLSSLALASVLRTDIYTQAAGAEANGVAALQRQVAGDTPLLCLNQANPDADGLKTISAPAQAAPASSAKSVL